MNASLCAIIVNMTEFEVADVEAFMNRVEHLLVDRKMNKSDLSRKSGIKGSTLRTIMSDRTKFHPRSDFLFQIAKALGVSMEYLMSGKDYEVEEKPKISASKQRWLNFVDETNDEDLDELYNVIKSIRKMDLD